MNKLLMCLMWTAGGVAFTGCATDVRTTQDSATIAEEDRYGRTAIVAWSEGDIEDLNPLTRTMAVAGQIIENVLFAPLLTYDEHFSPQPVLARSWELAPDGRSLTFFLREDMYWHDGPKVSAHDVIFAYERAADPSTGFAFHSSLSYYGEAEVIDSFTFRVGLSPHAEYLEIWQHLPPVPRHILEDVPPAQLRLHPFGTSRPVGNGPFRFVSRQIGQSWTFDANPTFPQDLGGRPYLDRVVIRIIPEVTTMLTELLIGGVHVAPISSESVSQVQQSDRLRLVTTPTLLFLHIGWNQRRPLFQDVRVRRALTHAIDRQGIVDALFNGYGAVANSPVPPSLWYHDPDAGSELVYDPQAARRLLADAGWTDRNGSGVLMNESGQEFRFSISVPPITQLALPSVAQKIQADLRAVGIATDIRLMEFARLIAEVYDPRTRSHDAEILGFTMDIAGNLNREFFHCAQRERSRWQSSGACSPSLDRLLDTLPQVPTRDAARPLWLEYQKALAAEQPWTFLVYPTGLAAVSQRLVNVRPYGSHFLFAGVRDWWLMPE